ncbi:hypothetical protein CIPAW_09G164700 [Carya illinoinensis]|uniref:RNase H type-1 domain-containing protein n=1 Tax=Carya illinoinensis TaxID=32201 RepID=A0A8T1PEW2_CARIL|nr:hypothetical protein CIPAW_09G164700 [Carya illinoinensis]
MKPLQVFVDGSSCQARGGVRVHIIMDKGEEHDYAVKLAFKATNNKEEYEALFFNLTIAKSLGVKKVEILADSRCEGSSQRRARS